MCKVNNGVYIRGFQLLKFKRSQVRLVRVKDINTMKSIFLEVYFPEIFVFFHDILHLCYAYMMI